MSFPQYEQVWRRCIKKGCCVVVGCSWRHSVPYEFSDWFVDMRCLSGDAKPVTSVAMRIFFGT